MINNIDLTLEQKESQEKFNSFVKAYITPYANQFDQGEYIPDSLIQNMIANGLWAAEIPKEYGGCALDMVTYGLLNEEIGFGCANVRNIIGVQGMVSSCILRWGTKEQQDYWLPKLASGRVITAFALTEPDIGSDAKNIQTSAVQDGNEYILNGSKKWITFGHRADLFLIFAQNDGKIGAFLLERNTPGFSSKPITGLLGFRGSMLAELSMENCRVPQENLIGKIGFGLSHVASHGLTFGRYSTAWGCVGLAQACLDACISYTSNRKQFDTYLKEHQLIQQMIADMVTNIMAARLLCYRSGVLKERGDRKAALEISVAKYLASTTAFKIANDAVQIHGANGCGNEYAIHRFMRDAKIMEIIEGSTQIHQLLIARHAYHKLC